MRDLAGLFFYQRDIIVEDQVEVTPQGRELVRGNLKAEAFSTFSSSLASPRKGEGIEFADFPVSAQCNRVAVEDGHTESVSVQLRTKASAQEIMQALREFYGPPQQLRLPSAPEHPVVVMGAQDRPQPRFDVNLYGGMTAIVGRIRPCSVLDFKFTVLGHNTVRGAAGASILNAELLKAQGFLD